MATVASAPNFRASLSPRLLRSADADHAARPHLLRRRDREDADRPRALDDDRVAPFEAARADRAVEGADAGGERFRERAKAKRHVVRQLVDLRARQHVEIDIDVFGKAAPQMRRLGKAEIAPVIDRRQALVGVLGVVDAVIAASARHQRRDHDLRADGDRLSHEVLAELVTLLDDDAADLVAERERPRQRLRPVAFQDVLVGTADATRADLDERRVLRHRRPGHRLDDGLCARPGEGRDADVGSLHGSTLVIAVLGLTRGSTRRSRSEALSLSDRDGRNKPGHDNDRARYRFRNSRFTQFVRSLVARARRIVSMPFTRMSRIEVGL
jgi:hypothetical protein